MPAEQTEVAIEEANKRDETVGRKLVQLMRKAFGRADHEDEDEEEGEEEEEDRAGHGGDDDESSEEEERAEGEEGAEEETAAADEDEDVKRAEIFADYLEEGANSLPQGMEALLQTAANIMAQSEGDAEVDTERMRAGLMDFATWGSSVLDADGLGTFLAGLGLDDAAPEEEPEAEPDAEEGLSADELAQRALVGFAEQMKAADLGDAIWRGTMTLSDTLFSIMVADGDDAPDDKVGAMRATVEEFSVWMLAKIDEMVAAAALTASAFEPDQDEVARAGKKIAGKRLAKLKDLLANLTSIIDELDDVVDSDEVENSERSGQAADAGEGDAQNPAEADPAASSAADNGAPQGDAAAVDRNATGGAAAQATTVKDPAALLQALEEMVKERKALEERVRFLETARPPASGAGGGVEVAEPTNYDKVAAAFGFGSKQ